MLLFKILKNIVFYILNDIIYNYCLLGVQLNSKLIKIQCTEYKYEKEMKVLKIIDYLYFYIIYIYSNLISSQKKYLLDKIKTTNK